MRLDVAVPNQTLASALATICELATRAGGRPLLVGGCVRDAVLGLPLHDLDIEVFGLAPERLRALIGSRYPLEEVGRAFPVLKLHGMPVDVSIPRCLSGSATGHASLEAQCDPGMSVEEAASRRDFTINAMAWDPASREVLDSFGGLRDLETRVLRHTSDKFVEDPLRVLRGMQFVARFDLTVSRDTVALCRSLTIERIPAERLFEEWKKLLLQGRRPSRGLEFLADSGWTRFFPELEPLRGCAQEPDWHPEGDVWIHTLHCLDAFANERLGDEWEDLVVGFAVLCHDFGKPATTRHERGRITSKGHEPAGEGPTRAFLGRLTNQRELADQVVALVLTHLRPQALYDARAGDSAIRRLARQIERIDRLVRVARCDQMGRPPRPFDGFPAGDWLLARAQALAVERSAPQPLVMGRHLLELGLSPGPRIGKVLDACYEAQLDGAFSTVEQGIEHAKVLLSREGESCGGPAK